MVSATHGMSSVPEADGCAASTRAADCLNSGAIPTSVIPVATTSMVTVSPERTSPSRPISSPSPTAAPIQTMMRTRCLFSQFIWEMPELLKATSTISDAASVVAQLIRDSKFRSRGQRVVMCCVKKTSGQQPAWQTEAGEGNRKTRQRGYNRRVGHCGLRARCGPRCKQPTTNNQPDTRRRGEARRNNPPPADTLAGNDKDAAIQ